MRSNNIFAWVLLVVISFGVHANEKLKILPYPIDVNERDFSAMLGCYYSKMLKSNGLFPSVFRLTSVQGDNIYYTPTMLYFTYQAQAINPPMHLNWRVTGKNEFTIDSSPSSFLYYASFKKEGVNSWHTVFNANEDAGHHYKIEATYEKLARKSCNSGEISKKIRKYCCVPSAQRGG